MGNSSKSLKMIDNSDILMHWVQWHYLHLNSSLLYPFKIFLGLLWVRSATTLYYISGYVTHKEGLLPSESVLPECTKESEFTNLVSRGQLSHPSADLYHLSQYLFSYYKNIPVKSCTNRLIVAFQEISEVSASYEYDKSVFRRFANCFSKGYAVQSTDEIKRQKEGQKKTDAIVKQRRLRF